MTLTRLESTERISQANPRETTRKRFRLNTNDPVHSPRLEPRQTTTLGCMEGTSFTTMPLTTGRDMKSNPNNSNKGITVGNDLTDGFSENPSTSQPSERRQNELHVQAPKRTRRRAHSYSVRGSTTHCRNPTQKEYKG